MLSGCSASRPPTTTETSSYFVLTALVSVGGSPRCSITAVPWWKDVTSPGCSVPPLLLTRCPCWPSWTRLPASASGCWPVTHRPLCCTHRSCRPAAATGLGVSSFDLKECSASLWIRMLSSASARHFETGRTEGAPWHPQSTTPPLWAAVALTRIARCPLDLKSTS